MNEFFLIKISTATNSLVEISQMLNYLTRINLVQNFCQSKVKLKYIKKQSFVTAYRFTLI